MSGPSQFKPMLFKGQLYFFPKISKQARMLIFFHSFIVVLNVLVSKIRH